MHKRTFVWILVVVLAFVLGFLLARHLQPRVAAPVCPQPGAPGSSSSTAGSLHGGPAAGSPGSPTHLGQGSASGGSLKGNGATATAAGSAAASPGGGQGNGDMPPGGPGGLAGDTVGNGTAGSGTVGEVKPDQDDAGGGKGHLDTGDARTVAADAGTAATPARSASLAVQPAADTALGPADPDGPAKPEAPGASVVGARDFSYDKTGLPRYPNGVDKIASSMVLPAGTSQSDQDTNAAAITTTDAPDTVVAWYRAHLPSGWVEEAPPSADAMDQAAKAASAPTQAGSPLDAMFRSISAGQLQQLREPLAKMRAAHLTLFWPPDRRADTRCVLITIDRKTGRTAVLLTKKAVAP